MTREPSFDTHRLRLRPFTLEDAKSVQALAGDPDIARMTATIPHPYEDGMAEEWIGTHDEQFISGSAAHFAITWKSTGELVGAISIHMRPKNDSAEVGYWVGQPFWNRGICTEALVRVIQFGFEYFCLNRIFAVHMGHNPASGQVMKKAGMRFEGVMREALKRDGDYMDLHLYSILKSEFASPPSSGGEPFVRDDRIEE